MTEGKNANADIKQSAKRNKTEDEYGNRYDCRSGSWREYDEAIKENAEFADSWLTRERCMLEPAVLNPVGKNGRPYAYPPSLILYLFLKNTGNRKSYREGTPGGKRVLDGLGLPVPSYSTVHKSMMKYFGSGGTGNAVMAEAQKVLEKNDPDTFDPLPFCGSGICPEYKAPQTKVTNEKEEKQQAEMDAEAKKYRNMMEVMVAKCDVNVVRDAAVDGSGVKTAGPRTYFEYIWKVNERNFIKQHALIDVNTQNVLAFSITLEKPGDSAVFPSPVEGAGRFGIRFGNLYADAAYRFRKQLENHGKPRRPLRTESEKTFRLRLRSARKKQTEGERGIPRKENHP